MSSRGYRGRGRGGYRGGRGGSYGNRNNDNQGTGDQNNGYRGGDQGHRGRGGRGGGGGRYNPDEQIIGYKLLETKSQASPTETLMFCTQQCFVKLLEDESLANRKDWVDLVLTTLNNAFKADDTMSSYKGILKSALLPADPCHFLSTTSTKRLRDGLSSGLGGNIDKLIDSLENYLNIFYHLCAMDTLAYKPMIADIKTLKQLLKAEFSDYPELQSVFHLYSEATANAERKLEEQEMQERRQKSARRTGRVMTEEKPANSFREMSVYPTEQDLKLAVKLRKHKKLGAFESIEDYLDIQFRLLREDFVSTLRKGITEYKNHPTLTGAGRFRSGDVKIYENFTITRPSFGKNGITYVISIDKTDKMFRRINWASSKRLMYGSLLCLSLDNFNQNILFATIADRDNKAMEKDGTFEVQLLNESQDKYDVMVNQAGPFMAVESMAYFEAYAHVLGGLQKMSTDNFPLSNYIVSTQRHVSEPEYLKNVQRNYRFITKDHHVSEPVSITSESTNSPYSYDFLSYGSRSRWPSADQLGFNEAQYEAFKMALTKEFVVIQGPPGTGKTFIGLKIVETLLYSLYHVPYAEPDNAAETSAGKKHALGSSADHQTEREDNCPPRTLSQMLVVCFTNHALDQFLEGMLQFCPAEDIVRVGSRSKNEALDKCNIRNQRGRRSRQLHLAHLELRDKRDKFVANYDLAPMLKHMELSRTMIMFHDTSGLLTDYPEIYSQFVAFAQRMERNGENSNEAMSKWLECDVETYSSQNAEATSGGADPEVEEEVATEMPGEESIDVEGEAERELQNRMVDDEDENSAFLKKLKKQSKTKNRSAGGGMEIDSDGFQKVKLPKKAQLKLDKRIRSQICNADVMGEGEIVTVLNWIQTRPTYDIITDLPLVHRWRLYRHLVNKLQRVIAERLKQLQQMYTDIMKLGDDLRKQEDMETLKKAKVIGMTTTGAARMQSVLQQVGPEIVVVEEAAEVLEAHIITTLSKHCKHLILIGDHKQLKPNPTVYELAKEYNLDLSLFERMVNNGLPVKTLNIQHRMRPEVSKFMRHIYDRLDDHESVHNREPIEGLESSVFFFNHSHLEASDDIIMSHSNEFEADMVVGLASYLLRQKSYEPSDITIITMYTGQLLLIKKKMPKAQFEGVKITSVDNFQGEENKIIIISLVRSNKQGKLGFVQIENRVCVSLSRAQYGMYVFGNFDMLSKGSVLWKKMVTDAQTNKEFGNKLILKCRRHHNPAEVEKPQDFKDKAPSGGCQRICKRKLKCGHTCKMSCHSRDLLHEEYKCNEPCSKKLSPCNHPCTRLCCQDCQQCNVTMRARLPCQHVREVKCYMIYDKSVKIQCLEPCPESLQCGHKCLERCSETCTSTCEEELDQMCSQCGEIKKVPCHMASQRLSYTSSSQQYSYKCDTPCSETLVCGHLCTGTCYECYTEGHQNCLQPCNVSLACGHNCKKTCHDCVRNGSCLACDQKCMLKCSHDTKCTKMCSQTCSFHPSDVGKKCTWGCRHDKCERSCGEPCSHIPCDIRCEKQIKCAKCNDEYQCVGLCGDKCPVMCPNCNLPKKINRVKKDLLGLTETLSEATTWVLLKDCQHLVPMKHMDELVYRPGHQYRPTLVCCPYTTCERPVINTPRYITKTRQPKQAAKRGARAKPSVVETPSSIAAPVPAPRMPDWMRASNLDKAEFYSGLRDVTEQLAEHREENVRKVTRQMRVADIDDTGDMDNMDDSWGF